MFTKKALAIVLSMACLLSACAPISTPEPTQPSVASMPIAGPVVPVGEPEVRDLGPTTEVVWNCGSGGGTVVKHPSISVVTGHVVEWEVGGTVGVGLTIGEGVIPGGVELSSSLEGHYVTGFEQSVEQGTSWDLPAEPDTAVVYTVMWREVWQPGYINVFLADKIIETVNVRYRTAFQSEIVGKQPQPCSGEQPPALTQPPPAATPIPQSTVIASNVGPWLHNVNQMPSTGSQITWPLNTGEVLIVTGGRIRYGDFYCGDDANQICVVIITATRNQNVVIGDLIAQENWLGVTSVFNSEQTLSEVQSWFWRPPNCTNGCSKATVAFFEDERRTDTRTIQK
jgi:hypothetical protein